MFIQRYLQNSIQNDALLDKKMAFISGPRQIGKTHLAKQFLSNKGNYFNWDTTEFKRAWIKSPIALMENCPSGPVVFDELHKYPHWKNSLKGLYDQIGEELPIIVTGSARLDLYKKGGDSLLGRYLPYRLHPFSVAESSTTPPNPDNLQERQIHYPLENLINCSGFPEPLLKSSKQKAKRWSRLRLEQLVQEDIRDFKNIRNIELVKILVELLPDRVASPLSINSLKGDLQVAYATVRDWLTILQNLYICFKVPPYSKNIARALLKESKYYLFDWLPIKNRGALIENIVAVHLLKSCQFWTDLAYGNFELRYIRTKDKEEIDFCCLRDNEPWMLVECKSDSTSISPTLKKFRAKFPETLAFQLTNQELDRVIPGTGIRLINTEKFLSMLV